MKICWLKLLQKICLGGENMNNFYNVLSAKKKIQKKNINTQNYLAVSEN